MTGFCHPGVVPQIEVRPYDVADRDELVDVVFEAAGEGAPGSEVWGHHASLAEIYLTPYLDLEPASTFVVLATADRPATSPGASTTRRSPARRSGPRRRSGSTDCGGCPGRAGSSCARQYDSAVCRVRRIPVAGGFSDPRWPSHLHLDLMPVARGTGAAAGLMELWFERLREVGSPGCYLQTAYENTRAIAFFERAGFRRYGDNPVVPGRASRAVGCTSRRWCARSSARPATRRRAARSVIPSSQPWCGAASPARRTPRGACRAAPSAATTARCRRSRAP